jgi:aryl carrier-like protein
VDRKALPAPDEGEGEMRAYVGTRNEVEQALCEVWQEVLNRDCIGIHDNFFSLGGDSILSIRVVSMLKSRGIVLDIKEIFQHQTIEQLAMQASQGRLEREVIIDPNQIADLLINERDEASGDVIETVL